MDQDQDLELCQDDMVRVRPCEGESEGQVLHQLDRNGNQEVGWHCHLPSYNNKYMWKKKCEIAENQIVSTINRSNEWLLMTIGSTQC